MRLHARPGRGVRLPWSTTRAVTAEADGCWPVALYKLTHDVAVCEAPTGSVIDDCGGGGLDDSGGGWTATYDARVSSDDRRLERVDGRHGVSFAFRTGDETYVADGARSNIRGRDRIAITFLRL